MSEDHNMNTKHENLCTSEKRVQKTDIPIHIPAAYIWYIKADKHTSRGLRFKKLTTVGATNEPLYTAPPKQEWVELTDEEVLKILLEVDNRTVRLPLGLKYFARALEAKLKERNT